MTETLNRSGIYRFSLAFAVFVFLADITNVVGLSPYTVAIKYAYTAALVVLLYHYFSRFAYVSMQSLGPLLALAFFVATGVSFTTNLLRGIDVSYVTAFTASLAFSAAAFMPAKRFRVDAADICRDLRALFLLGSACYLLEASLKASGLGASFSYAPEIQQVKSIVCVLGVSLAILTRRGRLALLLLGITAVSLAVRPSSTLFIATAVCAPLSLALRGGFRRTYAACAWGTLGLAAATPWLFYWFFAPIAEAATSIEGYLKADLLEGHSNTDFRLEIIRLALRNLHGSILFGQGLSGNPNVNLGAQWPWWHEVVPDGMALIHSDWLVVVVQAGAVGAALFFLMFASVMRLRLRALATLRDDAPPELSAILSLSIVGAVAFFLYSSFNPMLPLYHIAHLFWFILFVSEMAAKRVLTHAAPAHDVIASLGRCAASAETA